MRPLILSLILVLGACRAPYMSDIADLTVMPDDLPPTGTPEAALNIWFDDNRYAPGPRVWQAEAELRRLPGAPLAYATEKDRSWWLSRARTVRDFCVTQKYIYYKLDDNGALTRAIMSARSQC